MKTTSTASIFRHNVRPLAWSKCQKSIRKPLAMSHWHGPLNINDQLQAAYIGIRPGFWDCPVTSLPVLFYFLLVSNGIGMHPQAKQLCRGQNDTSGRASICFDCAQLNSAVVCPSPSRHPGSVDEFFPLARSLGQKVRVISTSP